MTRPFTVTEQRAAPAEERSAQEQRQRLTTNGLHTLAAGNPARMVPVCSGPGSWPPHLDTSCPGRHAVDGSGDGEERKPFGRPTTY